MLNHIESSKKKVVDYTVKNSEDEFFIWKILELQSEIYGGCNEILNFIDMLAYDK